MLGFQQGLLLMRGLVGVGWRGLWGAGRGLACRAPTTIPLPYLQGPPLPSPGLPPTPPTTLHQGTIQGTRSPTLVLSGGEHESRGEVWDGTGNGTHGMGLVGGELGGG